MSGLNRYPAQIMERSKQAARLHKRLFEKPQEREKQPLHTDDYSLLQKAFTWRNGAQIQALFNGNFGDYGSQSEADQALCNHLSFLYDRNYSRIDAMFRQSGLYRGKWDEKHFSTGQTYGQATIEKAIAGTSETYQDRRPAGSANPGRDDRETQTSFSFVKLSSVEFRLPDWLIKGFLEKDTLSMFFGDPGCGKTFVGVDISCSVATGKPFHERPVAQGPVLYLAGEGHNGLKRRFRAWEIRHQVSLNDAPIYVSNGPGCFCDAAGAQTVNAAIEASGVKPVAVIVDTVARNFGPGDENSTQDMTTFVNGLDLIRTQYGCAVILIHHTGHADKSRGRGAMALKGALDAEFRLDKDDMGVVRMDCTKMKDFEPPQPAAFRINTVELGIFDEDAQEITSAVLDSTIYEPKAKKGAQGRGKNQTVALEILEILYQEHRDRLTNSNFDPSTARVLVTDWRDRCIDAGMSRQSWHACKKSLDEQSAVEMAHGYVERINA